jgi:hypothetical protein
VVGMSEASDEHPMKTESASEAQASPPSEHCE